MKHIRNGVFIDYKGHQLKLIETREEAPLPLSERTYVIWFEKSTSCPFDDFKKSEQGNGFYKVMKIGEVKNVFTIQTLGLYHDSIVEVYNSTKADCFQLATRMESKATDLKFKKVRDNWYIKEIEKSQLELVWEEILRITYSNVEYGHVIQAFEWLKKRLNGQL